MCANVPVCESMYVCVCSMYETSRKAAPILHGRGLLPSSAADGSGLPGPKRIQAGAPAKAEHTLALFPMSLRAAPCQISVNFSSFQVDFGARGHPGGRPQWKGKNAVRENSRCYLLLDT